MGADVVIRGVPVLLTMDPTRPGPLGALFDAAVAVVGGRIAWVGADADAPVAATTIDGSGAIALPGLVDCHTHAVWAGSRADEFERRLAGESYASILEGGGGILSTVRATRAADDATLAQRCAARLARMRENGVTTVEVKGGYGLDVATEPRLLRCAVAAGQRADVHVVPTFLGAHAIPQEYRHDRAAYVRQVIEEQLPAVLGVAEAIDAFVDRGAFTVEEGIAILRAGRAAGLKVRVHAEQIVHTGIAEAAAALGALSADHLERLDDAGIAAMARSGTVAVLLPAAMLYLHDPPPPIAAMRAAGLRFAVATDLNPGSSPVSDLWMCATLACVTMGLTVDEALRGITVNASAAIGHADRGVIRPGAVADVILVEPPPGEPLAAASLVQSIGGSRVRTVMRGGWV